MRGDGPLPEPYRTDGPVGADRLLALWDRVADAPDAAAKLRRFVLDLAVRGRLVAQEAEDEPANVLLERIIGRYEATIKSQPKRKGKVPSLPDDLELAPSDLPPHWEKCSLGQIVDVVNGRAYKKAEFRTEGVPILRVGNLFTSDTWHYTDLDLPDEKYCHDGDLLFAWSASFGPHVWRGSKAVFHYHIWRLAPYEEANWCRDFLYYVLMQRTETIKRAGHGLAMIHLTKGVMEILPIPLPPLAEQHRIVAKVEALIALCDRLEAARTEREAVRKEWADAVLSQNDECIEGRKALDKTSSTITHLRSMIHQRAFGAVSSDQRMILGQCCQLQNGYAFKSEWFSQTGIRLLRNANVSHGHLRWADIARLPEKMSHEFKRFELAENDIVLSLDRPIISTGIKVAKITQSDLPSLLLQRVGRFVSQTDDLCMDYLLCWLESPDFIGQIDPGRSNGVPHISSKQVEATMIPLPPLAEQRRIVAKVAELMALCDRLEASLAAADTARAKLLDALLAEALEPARAAA